MAMLLSAIRLAFRQSAPPSRFFGNVGRSNPASSITSKRNYCDGNGYDFRKEDFMDWNVKDFLFGSFGLAAGLVFYHHVRTSRYNTAHCENTSTSERGHHGHEKAQEKELSEACMSN
ncbi:unnamed protein product [Alopecurus aequalis]